MDPERHYEKLVKAKVQIVLVLTALVQLPDRRETWVEQSRTELMVLEKGRHEGHFVKVLPLQIQESFLVVGFTLLLVPPSSASQKLIAAFPGLDGLVPWAETSVAIEHFDLGSFGESDGDIFHENSHSQTYLSSFSTPLMEISALPDIGLRKSKQTVATLSVVVEEMLPKILRTKAIAEKHRTGPSFTQTYHGHTVRGTIVYGREHLYESPLAFTLPLKLLQFLAQDERRVLEEMEREPGVSLSDMIQAVPLDHQPNPITRGASFLDNLRRSTARPSITSKEDASKSTRARQIGLSEEDSQLQKLLRQQISAHRNIEVYYQEMTSKVEQRLRDNLEIGQGAFRRSSEKKEESVQWIPLNCCVQDLLVYDDGYQTNYQTTTVGAAAAHNAGFTRWANLQTLSQVPALGAYWDVQERGNDLIRDFKALQEILATCSSDFNSLMASEEDLNGPRIWALLKEIKFLNNEIVSFGNFLLSQFLTTMSTEGSARFVCAEIRSLIERLKQIDLAENEAEQQDPTQGLSSTWLAHCRRSIRETVSCTQDLNSFVVIAVQHECLVTDAAFVATPEWIMVKKTRECCLSQIITALATSFQAVLEDWWTNMAAALQKEQKITEQEQQRQDQHHPECRRFLSRDMDFISEESSNVAREDRVQEEVPTSEPSIRSRNSIKRRGKGIAVRRSSQRSTTSNNSSVGSASSALGGMDPKSRSKSTPRHPLEHSPQAKAQNNLFWNQLMTLGWLAQISSLLSTQGSELGMLLDFAQAVADARETVTISFHCRPQVPASLPTSPRSPKSTLRANSIDLDEIGDNSIQISGRRGRLTLSFGLEPQQFSLLPDQLKAGIAKIQVWPVLFSQGINEMQTISNLTGKSPLQRSINEEGLRHMQSYVLRYLAWHAQHQAAAEISEVLPDKTRDNPARPYATWKNRANLSSVSVMSNLSSDWDMVSPTKAELWNGEPLVAELLNHLEMAVLGHSDETRSLLSSSATSLDEGGSEVFSETTIAETVPGSAPGIFGTMVEFGTSKLLSFRGSKDTCILECAEALTRALGQIKTLGHVEGTSSQSWKSKGKSVQPDGYVFQADMDRCECFTRSQDAPTTMSFTSLWVTSHISSCKSAKDRTSMSVTLSQANLLRACHGLQTGPEQSGEDDWQAILDAMRSEIGVRIKNVERNLKLGDFAKDLLWLSAFGSPEPQQQPMYAFDASSSHYQESDYSPDAITLVRSLLPGTTQLDISGILTAKSEDDMDEPDAREDSVDSIDDDVALLEPNSPEYTQASDTVAGTSQLLSPILLESPPPPQKLVRSSTGPALAPVVTLDTNVGQEQDSNLSLSPFSGSQDALVKPMNIPDGHPQEQEQTRMEEHYTSFPDSFDEPVLAVRLARSLGLDALGKSLASDTSSIERSPQQARTQDYPPQNQTRRAVGMHRSTPSWSSQQSVFYQQQRQQQQQQIASPHSQKVPALTRRLSSFGLGLGLISKPKDSLPFIDRESLINSAQAHTRSESQGSVDYGGSSQISSPPGSSSSRTAVVAHDRNVTVTKAKKGKFAFNKVQLKFLPAAYRPPRRMTSNLFES
ncbi:Inositol polyphosphate 4-phosphatase type II [Gamsiella multidivaricata]|nr:Inositol polyphosphate 4-phosphatase type II [Gamsiella multidivaricata]